MSRRRLRCATGQALILVALAMPLFFSVVGLVIDGSNLMVHRRMMQNAADGAALAASQDLGPYLSQAILNPNCNGHWSIEASDPARTTLVSDIQTYSANNKGPATLDGGSCRFDTARCAAASDRNCYTWPYKGNNGLIEVRLRENVDGFITGVIDALFQSSLGNVFKVSARSVASAAPVTSTTTIPGTTSDGFTDPGSTVTGATHTTTNPDTNLGGNGVAFLMSRNCNAMSYNGAGSGGIPLGAFATNGGIDFSGNKPKKVTSLFYNKPGCPNNPVSPPSGTSQCTATAWGDPPPELNDYCVKTLVDLNQNNTLPITWPLKIPTEPTLQPFAWNASTDYPQKCTDAGTNNINAPAWTSTHAPGVYCRNGSITISGDLTGGDGYTFFALAGGTISISSNGTKLKFYWPSACGARSVTNTRPSTFSCFSRTLWTNSNWDPQALLYATFAGDCAICLTGNGGDLTGDLFAPNPSTFPPGPTQNGAFVHIGGGALTAGSGFIEAWNLDIRGNTGSYTGTGVPIIIPGGTVTTTDPTVTIPGTTIFGTTVAGSTQTQTTGTTLGLDE
jgi:Putative Flp pilus-assembly TadE/G-like